jgi:cytochrome c oxidase cbb3-type subunit III
VKIVAPRAWGRPPLAIAVVGSVALLLAVSCERESRPVEKLTSAATQPPTLTDLFAGGIPPSAGDTSPFQQNAWGMAEGKRLFTSLNCVGCHANGGGGMGPALMDDKWIYGSRPTAIFSSIVEGRPNGMPSWRNKIADAQVWQIVAYVQSMSGQAPQAAMPSRSDHMRSSTPENARRAQTPVRTGQP